MLPGVPEFLSRRFCGPLFHSSLYSCSCLGRPCKAGSAQDSNKARMKTGSSLLCFTHTPNENFKTICWHQDFQARQSLSALNNCHEFQGPFWIIFSQFLNLAEYCSLTLTTKKQLLQENQIGLTSLLTSFHLQFISECNNQKKQGRALFCFFQTHFKEHYTQPAYTVVWLKKMFPLIVQLHCNGKLFRLPNPPRTLNHQRRPLHLTTVLFFLLPIFQPQVIKCNKLSKQD